MSPQRTTCAVLMQGEQSALAKGTTVPGGNVLSPAIAAYRTVSRFAIATAAPTAAPISTTRSATSAIASFRFSLRTCEWCCGSRSRGALLCFDLVPFQLETQVEFPQFSIVFLQYEGCFQQLIERPLVENRFFFLLRHRQGFHRWKPSSLHSRSSRPECGHSIARPAPIRKS